MKTPKQEFAGKEKNCDRSGARSFLDKKRDGWKEKKFSLSFEREAGERAVQTRIVTGVNPVLELFRTGRKVTELFISRDSGKVTAEIERMAMENGLVINRVGREFLDKLAGHGEHRGVLAIAEACRYFSIEELLSQKPQDESHFFVLMDGIEDPRNVGAIIRSSVLFGASGIILPSTRSSPLSDTVSRTSQGAIEYARISMVTNLRSAMEKLKEAGIWLVGLEADGEHELDKLDLTVAIGLVLGGEGSGLRRLIRETCDFIARIPVSSAISSLNVSVASGIAMYEVIRQRKIKKNVEKKS